MPQTRPALVWFRQDLRLSDNPALHAAAQSGAPIFALFVHDDEAAGAWKAGSASRWWLRMSLASLRDSLDGALHVYHGDASDIVPQLVEVLGAGAVYWNRCVEPWRTARDEGIKRSLLEKGVEVHTFNGCYLYDPSTVLKKDGTPYRVFTPYWRNGCLEHGRPPREPLPAPTDLATCDTAPDLGPQQESLLPAFPWFENSASAWEPGEAGAQGQLDTFLSKSISRYDEGRDRPDLGHVSRLSPHLHFGEVSPHQVRQAALERGGDPAAAHSVDRFLSELGWREFSAYLLYHEPRIVDTNLQRKFDRFPWQDDAALVEAWQRGETGYPIVDAGMRELWRTGYMHNRVRMITASFLIKNLLQDWRHGAAWFWDKLLDADLANNSSSWQWVAGSGADAAPFFRIFNPVTQGRKFDPQGDYVRRYVPELADVPKKYVHCPWEAPGDVLDAAGVTLGRNYPQPLVDLKASRERALDAFKSLGSKG
jgi:deoxyribodipyrimidine photo-lyase